MNLAAFRVRFPEFDAVGNGLIQATLDEAALEMDAEVWGLRYDAGHGYLAAHKLALSPYGQAARVVGVDRKKWSSTTTYFNHYSLLREQVTPGWIRVC